MSVASCRREVREGRAAFESSMEFAGEYLDENEEGGRTREMLLDLAAHSHHNALERLADMVGSLVGRIEELEREKAEREAAR